MSEYVVPSETRIGHVHLKVSDLERSLEFYCGLLGFQLTQRYGADAAFVSAGGYHHHIGLNQWHSKGAGPAPQRAPGLFHAAILYATREELYEAVKRVEHLVEGSADHGVSEAFYLSDPDGNGLELYWDKPENVWPRDEKHGLAMYTRPL
ncbi:MAG: VOC family protein [Armatimonadota bacterium]